MSYFTQGRIPLIDKHCKYGKYCHKQEYCKYRHNFDSKRKPKFLQICKDFKETGVCKYKNVCHYVHHENKLERCNCATKIYLNCPYINHFYDTSFWIDDSEEYNRNKAFEEWE